jgi:hypothetical protein
MGTAAPLDELSFIFFLRTLRLEEGDTYSSTGTTTPRATPSVCACWGAGR